MKHPLLLLLLVQFKLFSQTTVTIFYFETGKHSLSAMEKKRFLEFKDTLPTSVKIVSIEGFCDTVGTVERNEELAKMRIETIAQLLGVQDVQKKIVNGEKAANSSKLYKDSDFRKVAIRYRLPPSASSSQLLLQSFNTFLNDSSSSKLYFDLSILFHPSTTDLLEITKPELDTLLALLQNNRELKIIIHGHVCCEKDYVLSLKRAITVL